jgi:hypothetical protein
MSLRLRWVILAVLVAVPVAVFAAWQALPRSQSTGPCASLARIEPTGAQAVAFSTQLRYEILDNPGGPFQFTTTDREITSYVAINTAGRQVADPQVHFVDGSVCLSGQVVGLGLVTPHFQIQAEPYIADGTLQLTFSQITLNGRALPGVIRRLTQRVTNESMRDAVWPLRLESVRIGDREITLAGDRLASP